VNGEDEKIYYIFVGNIDEEDNFDGRIILKLI
jgi:hypothetical protein